jgi:hypothetical protein
MSSGVTDVIELDSDNESPRPKSEVDLRIGQTSIDHQIHQFTCSVIYSVLAAYPFSPVADIDVPPGCAPLDEPFAFSDFWLHIDRLCDSDGNVKGTDINYRALASLGFDSRVGSEKMYGWVHCDTMAAIFARFATICDQTIKFVEPLSVAHIRSIGHRVDADAAKEFACRPSLNFNICDYEQIHFICRINDNHWVLVLFESSAADGADGQYCLSVFDSAINGSESGSYVSQDKESLVGDLR